LIVQGRKRMIGHYACHTRPREVEPNLIAQAAHVFVFDTPNPDDRKRLADLMGVDPGQFDELVGGLPEYGFLWLDRRAKTLTECPPLR
jgi:hypothetical protein